MSSQFIPVILSGGSGTRLWPLSRESFPKQFVQFDGSSLFEKTLERLKPLGEVFVIGSVKHKNFMSAVPSGRFIGEPVARNTAPAISLVVNTLLAEGMQSDAVVGFFPADHEIKDNAQFHHSVNTAIQELKKSSSMITLGMKVQSAHTGYGYIELKNSADFIDSSEVSDTQRVACVDVVSFKEKPNAETAQKYMESGHYVWNAGIFICKLGDLDQILTDIIPDIHLPLKQVILNPDKNSSTKSWQEVFPTLPSISFDYAVMEKLEGQKCIPCQIGWSDWGSFEEIAKHIPSVGIVSDQSLPLSNSLSDPSSLQSLNNWVFGEAQKSYALCGLQDLIVVDTPDALLIAKKGQSGLVQNCLKEFKEKKIAAAIQSTTDIRPWGWYQVLRDEDQFKSKIICVKPGQRLSYQSHEKRAEHWIIVSGTAHVTLDGREVVVPAGQNIFIPQGAKHRVQNQSQTTDLKFIEVQVGTYFGEDDIVRYSDDYGRSKQ